MTSSSYLPVESPPFDRSTLRSVYHVRNTDVYRMKCLENSEKRLDIMVSHDWPLGIYQHGNVQQLLRKKPFFRKEVEQNALGSPPNREILDAIKPKRWFSAHLHVKFEATVVHNVIEQPVLESNSSMQLVPSQVSAENKASVQLEETGGGKVTEAKDPSASGKETTFQGLESSNSCELPDLTEQMTKFLALDKCLPRRQYLSVINLPKPSGKEAARLEYDPEWLAIVRKTNHLTFVGKRRVQVPSETTRLSNDDIDWVVRRITEQHGDLTIPENFCQTVPIYSHSMFSGRYTPFPLMGNPQTDNLLSILGLTHSITVPFDSSQALWSTTQSTQVIEDENEIDIDDFSDGTSGNIKEQPDAAKPHNTNGAEDENEIDLSSIEDAYQDHVIDEGNAKGVDGISRALKKPRHDVPNELE
jgi:lariat debranching enzyme